jgi:hypothetical protein
MEMTENNIVAGHNNMEGNDSGEDNDDDEDENLSDNSSIKRIGISAAVGVIPAIANSVSYLLQDEILVNDPNANHGGSQKGKCPNKNRIFELAHTQLIEDYFTGPLLVFNEVAFCHRFCVDRDVFSNFYEENLHKGLFS